MTNVNKIENILNVFFIYFILLKKLFFKGFLEL